MLYPTYLGQQNHRAVKVRCSSGFDDAGTHCFSSVPESGLSSLLVQFSLFNQPSAAVPDVTILFDCAMREVVLFFYVIIPPPKRERY